MWSLMEVLLQPLLDLYRVYRTHQVVVTLVLKVSPCPSNGLKAASGPQRGLLSCSPAADPQATGL